MSDTELTPQSDTDATETDTGTQDNPSEVHNPESIPAGETQNGEPTDTSQLDAAIERAVAEATEQAQRENTSLTTELTQSQQQLSDLQITNEALGIALNRLHVSIETGIPTGLLTGQTREEIEVSAAALKSWKDDKPTQLPTVRGPLKSGANLSDSGLAPTAAGRAAQLLRDGYR